jgi:uncharacterized protein YlaI
MIKQVTYICPKCNSWYQKNYVHCPVCNAKPEIRVERLTADNLQNGSESPLIPKGG